MKKYLLIVLLAFSAFALNGQESKSYQFTLEDCLRFAFSNSYQRQSMALDKESQQISYEQSKRQRLPNLNASFGENFSNNASGWSASGNVGVGSSVVIYQGGSLNKTIEQNRIMVDRTEAQLERYDDQLTLQILQSFLTILGNDELLKYQAEVLKTSGEQLKQGRVKYKVGSILESDLLLLEAQYYSDSNSYVDTHINRDNNLLNLKGLLSMNPTDELQIISPDTETIDEMAATLPTEEEAILQAMSYLPELKLIDYNIQIAQKSVDLARSNFFPSVSANANVGMGVLPFNANGMGQWYSTPNESVGLSVSIPIYNRGATKSNVKKSQIALEQAQLDHEQGILDARQTVVQAYRNVISDYNAYKASQVRENAYSKSFDAYSLKYQHGTITTVELLQQQNNYLNALNSYIQNKYTLIMDRKVLDVYMGQNITL